MTFMIPCPWILIYFRLLFKVYRRFNRFICRLKQHFKPVDIVIIYVTSYKRLESFRFWHYCSYEELSPRTTLSPMQSISVGKVIHEIRDILRMPRSAQIALALWGARFCTNGGYQRNHTTFRGVKSSNFCIGSHRSFGRAL